MRSNYDSHLLTVFLNNLIFVLVNQGPVVSLKVAGRDVTDSAYFPMVWGNEVLREPETIAHLKLLISPSLGLFLSYDHLHLL